MLHEKALANKFQHKSCIVEKWENIFLIALSL